MLVKIHKGYRIAVAVCDEELIGKRFEEGNKQLDLTGDFFRGERMDSEATKGIIEDALAEDASFNIVGEKSCRLARDCGLVKDNEVFCIQDIPIVLCLS